MTTAHRPTFDPAKGTNNAQAPTRAYHARMLPAHTRLKRRQTGQGGAANQGDRDFKADLALAEVNSKGKDGRSDTEGSHLRKETAQILPPDRRNEMKQDGQHKVNVKDIIAGQTFPNDISPDDEDEVLEAPTSKEDDEDEDEDDEDDEDETKALMQELEKIKQERNLEKEREMASDVKRNSMNSTTSINPLLSTTNREFKLKRKWDEDVVFKHQAMKKSTRQESEKDFVNDLLRSDFHRNFMRKYCT